MAEEKQRRDRFLTILIVLVSVIGVFYFGLRAIHETNTSNQENPFEYNLEHFKDSDSALYHYEEIRRIELDFGRAYAVAVGPQDQIYLSGDSEIRRIGQNGTVIETIPSDQPVRALTVDQSGAVYAATDRHIRILDSAAKPLRNWVVGDEQSLITSVAVCMTGLFVADAGKYSVYHYDFNGDLSNTIGPDSPAEGIPGFVIPSPYFDVAIDPDGFLWVVNPGNHLLENFTAEGSYRASWGVYSMTAEGFSGCCNPSHIAILSDGSFVTSEKGIPRVKVYNAAGRLAAMVAGPEAFREDAAGIDLAVDSEDRIYVLDPVGKNLRLYKKKTDKAENEAI